MKMKFKSTFRTSPGLNTAIGISLSIIAGLLLVGSLATLLKGRAAGPVVKIPVASCDIEMGSTITAGEISTVEIPERYVVPGTVRDKGKIIGNRTLRFMGKGEPFTETSISSSSTGSLATRIPQGFRAYPLTIEGKRGAEGEIKVGDRVDVIATSIDTSTSKSIAKNRLVISIGGKGKNSSIEEAGILQLTLLVTPQEAELLAQSEVEGRVSVVLCPLNP